eukprot:4171680-Pleurochrysis_carterae.AAC.1
MVRSSMPTSERRSDDHLLSSSTFIGQAAARRLAVVLKDSLRSSAIADGGGVNLLKNCRVGDMPAYKTKQLLRVQVVGVFALDVLFFCWSSGGLAASSSRSGARMRMSW